MSDDSAALEIIAGYPRLLVENYCIIASTALLWFDFALTFTREVRRIWGRKFTGASLVYLFTRYTALVDRVLFVTEVLLWRSSDTTCGRISHTDDVLLILNYFAFASFTILRVYGVWGQDWKPLLLVVPLTLIKPVLLIYESTRYTPVQAGPPIGCVYIYGLSDEMLARLSTAAKSATIASDAILIALTWVKTFGIQRASTKIGVRTPLATLLLRDGTAYFIILLVIQIITITSSQIGSDLTVWLVWPYFDQTLTVIFLSRFMLDLRGLYFTPSASASPNADATTASAHALSDLRFSTSHVVGNLGATLTTTLTFSFSDSDSGYPSTAAPSVSVRASYEVDADAEDKVGVRGEGRMGVDRQKDDVREGEGQAQGVASVVREWYEDELPEYTRDPFGEGMKKAPGPYELAKFEDMPVPQVTVIEVEEGKDSPVSPSTSNSPV